MGLDLAKDQVYLERTKLRYVNIPNILNDALFDRRARVHGVVGIVLGQLSYWIFMREGEAVNAVRRERGKAPVAVPISEVLRAAERGDDHGQAFYYGVPEGQLRAMMAITGTPLDAVGDLGAAEPRAFFLRLQELQLDAVLELEAATALHYLVLKGGEVAEAYLAGVPAGQSRSQFLRSLMDARAWRDFQIRLFRVVSDLPVQASPGLVRMYVGLMERTLERLSTEIGREAADSALATALVAANPAHPCLGRFELQGGHVVGEPISAAEALTPAIADWFLGALRSAERSGLASAADVAEEVTQPERMALREHGFLLRLPWPL